MEKQNGGQEPTALSDCPEFLALNINQRKFVIAYLAHGNGEKAYIEAGYSKVGARSSASKLLTNTNVRAALEAGQRAQAKQLEDKYGITNDRILQELARIAFSNMKRLAEWDGHGVRLRDSEEISEEDAACIKTISYSTSSSDKGDSSSLSFATHDKVKALHLLANMRGMVNGDIGDADKKPVDSGVKDRLRQLRLKYTGRGNGVGES